MLRRPGPLEPNSHRASGSQGTTRSQDTRNPGLWDQRRTDQEPKNPRTEGPKKARPQGFKQPRAQGPQDQQAPGFWDPTITRPQDPAGPQDQTTPGLQGSRGPGVQGPGVQGPPRTNDTMATYHQNLVGEVRPFGAWATALPVLRHDRCAGRSSAKAPEANAACATPLMCHQGSGECMFELRCKTTSVWV